MTNNEWLNSFEAKVKFFSNRDCDCCPAEELCKDGTVCEETIADWLKSEHIEPLKPCPFCGSDDTKVIGHWDIVGIVGYSVQCMNCGSRTGMADSEETAKEHWNERWSE